MKTRTIGSQDMEGGGPTVFDREDADLEVVVLLQAFHPRSVVAKEHESVSQNHAAT